VRKGFFPVLILTMAFVLLLAQVVLAEEVISNSLELEVTVVEVEEEGAIAVNENLARVTSVGLWDIFSVSTEPSATKKETDVIGKVKLLEGEADGFKLEYLEQNPSHPQKGQFFDLRFTGYEDGKPVAVDSQ